MKKLLKYGFICIAFTTVIFLIYILDERNHQLEEAASEQSYMKLLYGETLAYSLINESENFEIDRLMTIESPVVREVSIEEIEWSSKIIVYFDEMSCMTCVDDIFKIIKSEQNERDSFDFIVVGRYSNLKDLILLKKSLGLEKEVYGLEKCDFSNRLYNKVFLAVLDQDHLLHHVLVVSPETKHLVRPYIESIAGSKYWEKESA